MIARHEQDFLERRTRSERIGDAFGRWIGSIWFVLFHAVWIGGWIAINMAGGWRHFDPPPFPLLDSVVAIEAIFIASFILMRQSRLSRRSDERDHLILQILLLTEREITAIIGIEKQIAGRFGLEEVVRNETIEQLSKETPIDAIKEQLEEHLSDN